jgi:hypothetical protein
MGVGAGDVGAGEEIEGEDGRGREGVGESRERKGEGGKRGGVSWACTLRQSSLIARFVT